MHKLNFKWSTMILHILYLALSFVGIFLIKYNWIFLGSTLFILCYGMSTIIIVLFPWYYTVKKIQNDHEYNIIVVEFKIGTLIHINDDTYFFQGINNKDVHYILIYEYFDIKKSAIGDKPKIKVKWKEKE